MSVYEAFDKYLDRGTWHTGHSLEDRAFYEALAQVVQSEEFNADELGEYMRTKKGLSRDTEHPFLTVVDKRKRDAWAVVDFLKYGMPFLRHADRLED